jgi:hypothetical protein
MPKVRISQPSNNGLSIQNASPASVGTGSIYPRAWKSFPVTASDKGADRSHKPSTGHVILEVAVEN